MRSIRGFWYGIPALIISLGTSPRPAESCDGFLYSPPGLDFTCNAMVIYDDGTGPALYIGGDFSEAGGNVVNGIAKWDGANWQPLRGGLGQNGIPGNLISTRALAVYKGELIAGGSFTTADGQSANRLARWDGNAWHAFGTGIGGPSGTSVYSLAVYHDELFVGGCFQTADGVAAQNIARWDGSNWFPLGTGVSRTGYSTAETKAMLVYNDQLVVTGNFDTAGGNAAANIASWSNGNWHPLGGGLCTQSGALWANGRALAIYNNDLVVTGYFVTAGGISASSIARWDGTAWHALGSGLASGESGEALAIYGGRLFVGGHFRQAGGFNTINLASWDGSWHQTESIGSYSDHVSTLCAFDGKLFLGGYFSIAGNKSATNIALWGPRPSPAITLQPTSTVICAGSSARFTMAATSYGPTTYQWLKEPRVFLQNNGHYSGTNTPTLTITGADANDVGNYWCSINADCGGAVTNYVSLSFKPLIAADFNADCAVDAGDFGVFSACLTGPSVLYGAQGLPTACTLVPNAQGFIAADLDTDGDVDLDDFGLFQRCFSGTASPDPNCAQ